MAKISRDGDGEVTWLTDAEGDSWIALVGVMLRLPAVLDTQLRRECDVTLFEYFVLSALSNAKERTVGMSELAAIVNGSASRLANVVKRLESRGWVRRQPSPEDGRHTNAILTDQGWELVVQAAPHHVRAVRHLVFDALDEAQVEQLNNLCQTLVQRLYPPAQWPPRYPADRRSDRAR